MQLMTNINNPEKSGGALGIEEQSISATQIMSVPPPAPRCLTVSIPLSLPFSV